MWELSGNSSESDDEEENESVEEPDAIDASDSESEEDNVRANIERQRRGWGPLKVLQEVVLVLLEPVLRGQEVK